jgi:MerR family copper efflux transcriptional regulator
MRITDAADRLGTTARMLRYRERLGLLAPAADEPGRHRHYGAADLAAAGWAAVLEQRYDVSPAALAFALRVLSDPAAEADVRRLGDLTGRTTARALDFDQLKAQRLLRGRPATTGRPGGRPGPGSRAPASAR